MKAVLLTGPGQPFQVANVPDPTPGPGEAVARGDIAETKRLLAANADLKAVDAHHRTALHVAAHRSAREIAEALVAAGEKLGKTSAQVDDEVWSTLSAAASAPWVPIWPPTISAKMRRVSRKVSTVSNKGSLSSWLSLL